MKVQKSLPSPNNPIDPGTVDHTRLHSSPGQERYGSIPQRSHEKFSTFILDGIRIQAITGNDLLKIISEAVLKQAKYVITNHNMHSLFVWYRDSKMRDLNARANFTHIDGFPLIPIFRLFGARLTFKHRTAYMEFLPLLFTNAIQVGWRVYYLGSPPGVVEKGAALLREQYPGLQLRTHNGYFDPQGVENETILSDIRDYAPDVLLVGMGMPRQEAWIHDNLNDIAAHTIFCCGCTMDYIAGNVPSCPRWLGDIGFEWLYRLLSEPARLWRRYLVEPWFVIAQLFIAYFKLGRRFGASVAIPEDRDE